MGSIKREFKELLQEYDAIEDEEMVEFAMEIFKLGCKHGEEKAYKKMERGGFGRREEEEFEDLFEDEEDEDEDVFRSVWARGGFGRRGGGSSSGNGGGSGSGGGGGYGNRRGSRGGRGRGRR